ncbi:DNA gyrase subunit B [Gemmata obscuriglobus]|uniref:DNA topoisomerase (ATP-hydrolyzing) n=1 Tax=Gemmata obscuriglobus TaxID=114 RepID=A0A2Z3HA95_9BACT|nr:DNA gyrase subunit B [Gemmata obscuriglobus]AWM41362.1 DNA gyrase subunit B [Gemmata obscuriglobus]QEG25280.1 DNA gyrase subunit B [Gemmata obscuriglobus]VTR98102.1 dna gyrase subunit b : DNA topoisomerase type IIA subunit B region 2 domain protein OS=Planctomyces limnophilus (strain ATCC 43296 / DSM 3776 / IFAM 1008 / 290) GN=Plim_0450 PE=3 SV=1: HATPase_c: DNA_gyraseB: Toprim: DNA_gyraseB_C [Gemmata obscuriglobus UQM 2246]
MSTETLGNVGYTEDNLQTLKDAAHIRHRPGMYIGNTDIEGMHHLVWEVVYNSVDEALAGFCKNIFITVHSDESITVSDDGRGIPVGVKADTGKSTLEEALTIAGSSGKFNNDAYKTSAGLHGMGAKAMNALSEWCTAEIKRDGRVYKMEFEKGYATSKLEDLGPAPKGQTGTTITFKPDPEKFGDILFDYDRLGTRFQQISFLNKGLKLALADERVGKSDTFHSERGIAEYVEVLNRSEQTNYPLIYINKQIDGVTVEVCFQYTQGETKLEMCFTNNAYNKDGGTHLSGFRGGLTRAIGHYGKKANLFKEIELRGDDFREGLTAVINISHPQPKFESQTKVKLTSPEVEGQTSSVVYEVLSDYLERNPKEAERICKKVLLTAEARIAAKKARDAVKGRKDALNSGGLPGKLYDCSSRDRENTELFLVEGDSAGGSAESGRDREFQAILPLRGKVLNVEKAKFEKLLENNEISALISAVGVDIDNVEDVSKVRYGKIIIMTDADVDGQHIRTLLLTFFFRQMRKLIEAGHVFVARPPLYKVTQKKETRFIQSREEMVTQLTTRGLKNTTLRATQVDRPARDISGDELTKLLPLLDEAESAVVGLERRGRNLDELLTRAVDGLFPTYNLYEREKNKEHWFRTTDEVAAFKQALADELKREPVVGEDYTLDEWHDLKSLNRAVTKLKAFGFDAADLVPLQRIAGREPPVRYTLDHDGSNKSLVSLRELVIEIRRLGEKGIAVTRFKGLGEMDPEELWATTLDPQYRTLLKVTLNDAFKAEEMFRTLMGKEVQDRKAFIFSNSLKSVEDIDYGA